jgi:hypothetical protein
VYIGGICGGLPFSGCFTETVSGLAGNIAMMSSSVKWCSSLMESRMSLKGVCNGLTLMKKALIR